MTKELFVEHNSPEISSSNMGVLHCHSHSVPFRCIGEGGIREMRRPCSESRLRLSAISKPENPSFQLLCVHILEYKAKESQ